MAETCWGRDMEDDWELLFMGTIAMVWLWWNKSIYDPTFTNPVTDIQGLVHEVVWANGIAGTLKSGDRCDGWQPPLPDWVKVNTDGASTGNPGVSIGGLFRDSAGFWIGGFKQWLGGAHALTVELWVIWQGLRQVWQQGCKKVDLETDSQEGIDLIQTPNPNHPDHNLVLQIRKLFEETWVCRMKGVPCEANSCADQLLTKLFMVMSN
ncbi:hypothetical protein CsSME_00036582 [Camellia sinensis var. sinensis]